MQAQLFDSRGQTQAGNVPHAPVAKHVEHCDVHSSSDEYASRFAGALGEWMLDVQARAVLDLIAPWPGGRVLDVGGGHAQLAGPLAAAGFGVTILGSDERCGERPRRLLRDTGVGFVTGDIAEPPFAAGEFDVVLGFRLMAHVRDWDAMLRGLCRVARHAVVVDFASSVSVNAFASPLFGAKLRVETNTRPFRLQRRRDVQAAFARQGFTRFRHVGQYVAPMALHRMMNAPVVSRALENALRAAGLSRAFGSPVILRAAREEAALPAAPDRAAVSAADRESDCT